MKLVPIFDGTTLVGIRFVPDELSESEMLRAFAANGTEQVNGDTTMTARVVSVDARPEFGMVVKCHHRPASARHSDSVTTDGASIAALKDDIAKIHRGLETIASALSTALRIVVEDISA